MGSVTVRVVLRPACSAVFIKVSWVKNRAIPLLDRLQNTAAEKKLHRDEDLRGAEEKERKEKEQESEKRGEGSEQKDSE